MTQQADLYAIVEILGHDSGCSSRLPESSFSHEECTPDCPYGDCTVWETAKLILSSDNLNELLARTWDRGFHTCQIRVANDLLKLLPNAIDATNPYRGEPK